MYRSLAQRNYFHAHKAELERSGVDVGEWDKASKGKKLPKRAPKRESFDRLSLDIPRLTSLLGDPTMVAQALSFLGEDNGTHETKTRGRIEETPIGGVQRRRGTILLSETGEEHAQRLEGHDRDPNPEVRRLAESYTQKVGIPYQPHTKYIHVDPHKAKEVANAFHEMKHDPSHPDVKRSYDALIHETKNQWEHLHQHGYKMEPFTGQGDPYKNSAEMHADVAKNKHLWFFPTHSGFGDSSGGHKDHPLLQHSGIVVNGHHLVHNDIFRAVHDVFGHAKDGTGFGPRGEENAYQSHKAMYSHVARPAVASETRGQNSWVTAGPHAEHNRKNPEKTIYAEQKAGLLADHLNEAMFGPPPIRRGVIQAGISPAPKPITATPIKPVTPVAPSTSSVSPGDHVQYKGEDGDNHFGQYHKELPNGVKLINNHNGGIGTTGTKASLEPKDLSHVMPGATVHLPSYAEKTGTVTHWDHATGTGQATLQGRQMDIAKSDIAPRGYGQTEDCDSLSDVYYGLEDLDERKDEFESEKFWHHPKSGRIINGYGAEHHAEMINADPESFGLTRDNVDKELKRRGDDETLVNLIPSGWVRGNADAEHWSLKSDTYKDALHTVRALHSLYGQPSTITIHSPGRFVVANDPLKVRKVIGSAKHISTSEGLDEREPLSVKPTRFGRHHRVARMSTPGAGKVAFLTAVRALGHRFASSAGDRGWYTQPRKGVSAEDAAIETGGHLVDQGFEHVAHHGQHVNLRSYARSPVHYNFYEKGNVGIAIHHLHNEKPHPRLGFAGYEYDASKHSLRESFDILSESAIKYWYHPRTGKRVDVTNEEGHHAATVVRSPKKFGLRDPKSQATMRAKNNGWVRVQRHFGFKVLNIDAPDESTAHQTYIHAEKLYGMPEKMHIDVGKGETPDSYANLNGHEEVDRFRKFGRLPKRKTDSVLEHDFRDPTPSQLFWREHRKAPTKTYHNMKQGDLIYSDASGKEGVHTVVWADGNRILARPHHVFHIGEPRELPRHQYNTSSGEKTPMEYKEMTPAMKVLARRHLRISLHEGDYFSIGHPSTYGQEPNAHLWAYHEGKIDTHRVRDVDDKHSDYWNTEKLPAWGRADHRTKTVSIAWHPDEHQERRKDAIRKRVDRTFPDYKHVEVDDPLNYGGEGSIFDEGLSELFDRLSEDELFEGLRNPQNLNYEEHPTWRGEGGHEFGSTFKVGDQHYEFWAHHPHHSWGNHKDWDIQFANKTHNPSGDVGVTGTGHAHKVFSHVVDSLHKFLHYVKPDKISFSAKEKSRVKLYNHLIPHLATKGYQLTSKPQGKFERGRKYRFHRIVAESLNEGGEDNAQINVQDVQDFVDLRIIDGDQPDEALRAAEDKFQLTDLQMNPVGVVVSPSLPDPPMTPMQIQTMQQSLQMQMQQKELEAPSEKPKPKAKEKK